MESSILGSGSKFLGWHPRPPKNLPCRGRVNFRASSYFNDDNEESFRRHPRRFGCAPSYTQRRTRSDLNSCLFCEDKWIEKQFSAFPTWRIFGCDVLHAHTHTYTQRNTHTCTNYHETIHETCFIYIYIQQKWAKLQVHAQVLLSLMFSKQQNENFPVTISLNETKAETLRAQNNQQIFYRSTFGCKRISKITTREHFSLS